MNLIPSICCTRSLGEAFSEGFKRNIANNHSLGYFTSKVLVVWDGDSEKYEVIREQSLVGRWLTASPTNITENRTMVDLSTLQIDIDSIDEWIDSFSDQELKLLSSALKYYKQFALAFEIDEFLCYENQPQMCETIDIDPKALSDACKVLEIDENGEIFVPIGLGEED